MKQKTSYDKDDLLKCAQGELFGRDHSRVPTEPMLMIDRITTISMNGGKYDKGLLLAELDINKKNWFFHSHFIGDPVMPGCLGLDGMWQLIGFFLTWSGCTGKGRALGVNEVKFKGQVRPYHSMINYKINVKKIGLTDFALRYCSTAFEPLLVSNKTITSSSPSNLFSASTAPQ